MPVSWFLRKYFATAPTRRNGRKTELMMWASGISASHSLPPFHGHRRATSRAIELDGEQPRRESFPLCYRRLIFKRCPTYRNNDLLLNDVRVPSRYGVVVCYSWKSPPDRIANILSIKLRHRYSVSDILVENQLLFSIGIQNWINVGIILLESCKHESWKMLKRRMFGNTESSTVL